MTLDTIAKAIRTAILNSSDISTACNVAFSKRHKVSYSPSPQQAPGPEDCPVFIVHPVSKSVGVGRDTQVFTVKVVLAIIQSDPTVATNDTEFTGPMLTEALLDLAYIAARSVSSSLDFDGVEYQFGALDEFPVLAGDLTMIITVPNLIGAEVSF